MKPYKQISYACKICSLDFSSTPIVGRRGPGKALSEHIIKIHKLKAEAYTVQTLYGGIRPTCPICGVITRYVGHTFKKYCVDHSSFGESSGGKIGGKNKIQWNKGKTKEDDVRLQEFSVSMTGEGNHFYGKQHTAETKEKIAKIKRLSSEEITSRILEKNAELCSDYSSYLDNNALLSVKCKTCSTHDNVSLFNLERCWRCRTCHPIGSSQQVEILNFVKSLGFDDAVSSTRKIIDPLELDIWIPSKNVAIEYHGLYWHSGGKNGTFDKNTHRDKHKRCVEKGIKLLQFFSDEWRDRRNICESIIKNALGVNDLKLNARDCEVREIDHKISQPFLEANHLDSYVDARLHYGLFHQGHGLVGVVTVRSPRTRPNSSGKKIWGEVYELARVAMKCGFSVRGGVSKMLSVIKERVKTDNKEGLLSYADLRFGTGNVYKNSNFTYMKDAGLNYWYSDGHVRMNRNMFMANQINNLSEKEVAEMNGVRAVWGAGNAVYLWRYVSPVVNESVI